MDTKTTIKIKEFSGKPVMITVGMFDGLHRGHQYFLSSFVNLAKANDLVPVLIGMYPHPRKLLYNMDFQLLTSVEEKTKRLAEIGIDNYLIFETTKELLGKTAIDFIEYVKAEGLNIQAVAMGFNNRFGKPIKDEPDFETQMLGVGLDFYRIKPYTEKVNSTLIREALAQGKVDYANDLLGYPYSIQGYVVPGNRIGRKIGFPTANIKVDASKKLIPAVGVYAVTLSHNKHIYKGMMNVGYRPTIKENLKSLFLEVHVPGEELELYDQNVQIQFLLKIRDEKQFDSLEGLTKQLEKDKDFVKQYFNTNFVNSKNK
ncbi:MAG: riboflavin biosynthesis protein RibF [Bacteroidota bacterium]|nr:riboflavin biosynthesis protein RibF [Bacteroidota bacterium]